MSGKLILDTRPLGFTWQTQNPFLFCVHHLDHYPRGNDSLGPAASLEGRDIGNDFTIRDGWRMYHGDTIPGFPMHPHRGFETVTVVLEGFVDHSDSHGAAGRYGNGDVQWMTAGSGLQHAEMFPLLNRDTGNTLELFQIWLNLPAAKKFVEPHFKMLWAGSIPVFRATGPEGRLTEVIVIAGKIGNTTAPAPAPDSWAADPSNEVAIWRIRMESKAEWTVPPASPGITRSLFFFAGNSVYIQGEQFNSHKAFELRPEVPVELKGGDQDTYLLLLQGKPISDPVVQYGPFVMNTREEIQRAMSDYRRTRFGGWPWPRPDQVHGRDLGRFARYPDGRTQTPEHV
jgi:redox-sensitive bicupin YhaK (pirin superfamily)